MKNSKDLKELLKGILASNYATKDPSIQNAYCETEQSAYCRGRRDAYKFVIELIGD